MIINIYFFIRILYSKLTIIINNIKKIFYIYILKNNYKLKNNFKSILSIVLIFPVILLSQV